MSSIKVSIIIPFYEHVDWLIEAVDSVFKQTYKDFEVIVINDGSKEDPSPFLAKYQDRIVYKYKENEGSGSARNLGIEIAKGEYVAFLDSDDIWEPQKLELQLDMMVKTGAVWSHTYWAQFAKNDLNNIVKVYGPENQKNTYPGSLVSTNIATPCVMVKTDFFRERVDFRFHEEMRVGQDSYLWLLLSSEHEIKLLPEVMCKVRLTGNNTVNKARAHIQVRAMIWKYLRGSPLDIFNRSRVPVGIKWIYRFCYFENLFLTRLEKHLKINSNFVELVAKVVYILPYLGFRLYKIVLK